MRTVANCTLAADGFDSLSIQIASGTLTIGTYAIYVLTQAYNCTGPNTFTLSSVTAGTGWPPTITVSQTNCSAPPCAPASCGECSWPTTWTLPVSGISDLNCQTDAVLQEGSTPPAGWPDNPCWHQNGNMSDPLLPGCELLNTTLTLYQNQFYSPTGCNGTEGASLGWSSQIPSGFGSLNVELCNTASGGLGIYSPALPRADMSCCPSLLTQTHQFDQVWTLPTAIGLYLLIWNLTANAFYGLIQGSNGNNQYQYACEAASYPIPYFCPLSEIVCLQPITFTQLSYVWPIPDTIPPFPQSCQNFPSTVVVTPA